LTPKLDAAGSPIEMDVTGSGKKARREVTTQKPTLGYREYSCEAAGSARQSPMPSLGSEEGKRARRIWTFMGGIRSHMVRQIWDSGVV
jgi:hypothetical protein